MKFLRNLVQKKLSALLALIATVIGLSSCTNKSENNAPIIDSPLGTYQSNTQPQYQIEIQENRLYSVCSNNLCESGKYEKLPIKFGIILIDFYSLTIGQQIEHLSHGKGNTKAFYQAMEKYRLAQPRANDLPFNISNCDGVACVGLGHRRAGIKFYRLPQTSKVESNLIKP